MTQPSTPSPDAAGPTPTDNRVYHCICEAADGEGHLPACVLSNTTATSAIPIVAASPEGSAGLDAEKLQFLLEEWAEELDCHQGATDRNEPELVRFLASAIPSLIDASRERDELKKLEAIVRIEQGIHGDWSEGGLLAVGQALIDRAAKIASLEAQLTDARSRIAMLDAGLEKISSILRGAE